MYKGIVGVCSLSLKKIFRHPRFILFLILLYIYMDYTLSGIRNFCVAFDTQISFAELVVQMFSNQSVQGCFLLFYAFLLIDIPATDAWEQYILIRSGRWAWLWGKVLTVTCLTIIWFALIALYSMVIVRRVNLGMEWSDAMITLVRTDAYAEFSIHMLFSNKVITNYALQQALPLSLFLNAALVVTGGLWILLINFISGRPLGSFSFAAIGLMGMSIGGILNSGAIYKFSPASLAQLAVINGGVERAYPSLQYAVVFYAVFAILGIALLISAMQKRKDFSRFRV